ncbi:ArsR family transcriptional regulator [Luteococcus japonicus]|uniref:Transcriptional regulators, marR/emrR family n=2 Tax=Luteococcus japonicus TaxID=33984 RepID=A0A1R4IXU3_9ACTN|nr:transcriptional regulator [Luteococcus japonicus]ROR53826.1 ArsR family transcriptional regulator [Luteococcus japonicus]SJN24518.1 transcriptional regulators, marR/emrR family [Luteococcus japonicus LSP_Lj1]
MSSDEVSTPDFAVDRLVHEPARLGILSVLEGQKEADFQFLQTVLGLTKGNLSSHLSKLEAAGLIRVTKVFQGKLPRTMQEITPAGRAALERHWEQMDAIRNLGR